MRYTKTGFRKLRLTGKPDNSRRSEGINVLTAPDGFYAGKQFAAACSAIALFEKTPNYWVEKDAIRASHPTR